MEFVGKIVKKEFKGFGFFEGVVESYDSSTGFFKILYEDGDSEEADFLEVARLASSSSSDLILDEEKVVSKRVGRKPNRRRRNVRDLGKGFDNLVDFNSELKNLDIEEDGNLDLNCGLNLNDGSQLEVGLGGNVEIRECFDLNLSVDDEFDENGTRVKMGFSGDVENDKKEHWFDLNLGFNEEGLSVINNSFDDLKKVSMKNVQLNGNLDTNICVGSVEELKDRDGVADRSTLDVVDDGNLVNSSSTCDVQLEEGCSHVVAPSPCENGNSGRRKRRKVVRNINSLMGTELRRSARRAKAISFDESDTSRAMVVDGANDLSMSGVVDESEEKPRALELERLVESGVLPSKIELPPSSTNLDLDSIPVVDIFSIYSCLRSFSTLLYLSPFELEDFVAALKSRVSNLLIDCIHVSILQSLRKHLESLANEGCESASTCLRNLNWDLLDVITWPIFMVEYLLSHGSGLKPGLNLNGLKLFDGEYYKQPADVKIELLRCLCDDVIEVEVIRSELSRRTNMADDIMEIDRTMNNNLYKKRRVSSEAPGDSCLSEDVIEEVTDGNSDECCLCKMDGNLICCDGCPAAYHSKCVGIVSSILPEGDWYCPECTIGRLNFGSKPQKLVRGAELLGIDPYGRLYFKCFGYLLVSESDSYDGQALFNYYHKDDLGAIIQLLRSSDILYGSILSAISRCWAITTDSCQPKSDLGSEVLNPSDFLGSDIVKHGTGTDIPLTSSEGSVEVLQANQLIANSSGPGSKKPGLGASKKKKNRSIAGRCGTFSKAKEEDILQGQSIDGYINHYSFAHTAASVVEELLRKPPDKANVEIPKTEEEIISIQLKFILKKSSKFCWMTIQDLIGGRQKEKCGWCYCCRFPVEDRDCLFKFTYSIPKLLKAEVEGVLLKRNKKGHLVDVICYILCMEERLRGLLVGPWLSPHYSELWRKSVLKASDISSLKSPLLMLESNLRPLALSADWWKHVDSVTTMGSASHFVASSRASSKNGISRKKGKYAESEIKSLIAAGGLGLFWWRGGKISRSLFNWKVVPRSLALKAARKGGCVKIPGIQYPDGLENAKRSKFVTWRASVETSTSLEQLALQVRELDLFIRWDDIENTHPHFVLDKETKKSIRLFKKVIIRRKSVEGEVVKYLLDFGKRRSIPGVVLKHGLKLEDSCGEKKKYWLEEAYVPLHLLKSFGERRITCKASKSNPNKVRKGGRVTKKPLKEKGFDYLFSRAERPDNYQCGHCNKDVLISEAVSCQHCSGFFHKRHVMKSSEAITAECTYTCHRCRTGKHAKNESNWRKRKLGKLRDAKSLKVNNGGYTTKLRAKPRKKGKALANCAKVHLGNNKKMQYKKQPLLQKNAFTGITLRRSARNAKNISPQSNSYSGGKKRKRNNSRKVASKGTTKARKVASKETTKARKVASKETTKAISWQKSRTPVFHSFWKNGLRFSRKPNDERVVEFKKRTLLFSSEFSAGIDDQPKCSLCSEQGFESVSMYIACEICGDWFHGDAFGLNKQNIGSLIGFKCHVCCKRSPPICPFLDNSRGTRAMLTEARSEAGNQDTQELEVLIVQKEIDFHEVQNSDKGLDHDNTSMLDSKMGVENASFDTNDVTVNAVESQKGDSKANSRDNSRDTRTMLTETRSEAGNQGTREIEEVLVVQKEIVLHEVQNSDICLDHDNTSMLDSEFRDENAAFDTKDVTVNEVESQKGDLKADFPNSDEDIVLEGNKNKLNSEIAE